MNKYEKILRKQLEEYLEKGDFESPGIKILDDKKVLEASRKAEYIYEIMPLFAGGLNDEGKYENIHTLKPKGDKGMLFGTREVFEKKKEPMDNHPAYTNQEG